MIKTASGGGIVRWSGRFHVPPKLAISATFPRRSDMDRTVPPPEAVLTPIKAQRSGGELLAASKGSSSSRKPRRPPATTPEGRENQLVSLAVKVAEQQMLDGTASAQVITHFLKLATTREQLEQQRLRSENELLRAKVDALTSQARSEEMYREALQAMRKYSGHPEEGDEEDAQVLYGTKQDS